MKPRYLQVSLGRSTGPSMGNKLSGGGLNALWALEKWKMLVLLCSIMRPNFKRREDMML